MRFLFISLVLALAGIIPAKAQSNPPELDTLKGRLEKQNELNRAPILKLNKSYPAALQRLSETMAKAGTLDLVLEVKKEIKTFGDGSNFSKLLFEARVAENNRQLESIQRTYLATRKKHEASAVAARSKLLVIYIQQLQVLEQYLTTKQRIDDAIVVKHELEKLVKQSKSNANEKFRAKAHCVAKAEIECYLNGKAIRFRNSEDKSEYLDGISLPIAVGVGDVVILKQRGKAVYRGAIFGIKSIDKTKQIHFPASAFRLMGIGDAIDPITIDAGAIERKANTRVPVSNPDDEMKALWASHNIPECQFIKPPEPGEWATFGVVITEEMIVEW